MSDMVPGTWEWASGEEVHATCHGRTAVLIPGQPEWVCPTCKTIFKLVLESERVVRAESWRMLAESPPPTSKR